jgi:hypothetical protein
MIGRMKGGCVMGSRGQRGVLRFDEVWVCVRVPRLLRVSAVLVAVAVPLGFAPSALAAETGQIVGTVTDASTHAPIEGVEVCVRAPGGEHSGQCETTGSNGEYIVSKLPAGAYDVEFFVTGGNAANRDYAMQFYSGKSRRAEAELVTVTADETTNEINAAMQPGGEITGVVTDAVTHAPIEGIQVCTGPPEGENLGFLVRCASTDANGEYTLPALVTGEYLVQFSATPEGPLDYASQYYGNHMWPSQATRVPVTTGGTTSGIDAAMQPGGNITGRVTAAATGAALKGVEVCVVSVSTVSNERCAKTNASGEYTLPQLHAGQYAVEFGGSDGENLGYVREYYGGKASLAEADQVSVTVGVTVSGVDAAMHAIGEEWIKPPPVSETPLSAGLAVATPVLTKTPVVTQTPIATVMGSKLVVSGGAAPVRVACSQAACQGSIELTMQVLTPGGKGKTASFRKATLVLATGSFSLAEGRDGSVLLRLTPAGRQKLAHARRHPIAARLILSVRAGKATIKPVVAI